VPTNGIKMLAELTQALLTQAKLTQAKRLKRDHPPG